MKKLQKEFYQVLDKYKEDKISKGVVFAWIVRHKHTKWLEYL